MNNNKIIVRNKKLKRFDNTFIFKLCTDKNDSAYKFESFEYLKLYIQDWFWDEIEIANKLVPIATTYGNCTICEYNNKYYYIDKHESLKENFEEYEPLNKKLIDKILKSEIIFNENEMDFD